MNIKDKNIMITGAGKRIGRALAGAFALKGARLILHYNSSEDEAVLLKDELERAGTTCWKYQYDFADTSCLKGFVECISEETGGIDLLINSASIFPEDDLMSATEEAMIRNLKVNSFSPFFLCREIARIQEKGVFINILDTKISEYDSKHFSYHLSKRNLYSMTQMMALEFAPAFRVNAIAPGPVIAPEGESEEYLEKVVRDTPLQGGGGIGRVTDTALFLAENSFITGQVIFVDGGYHLGRRVYGL